MYQQPLTPRQAGHTAVAFRRRALHSDRGCVVLALIGGDEGALVVGSALHVLARRAAEHRALEVAPVLGRGPRRHSRRVGRTRMDL